MYAYTVTLDLYRQQGQSKQGYRLLWALLIALWLHLLFIGIATPIEKHDRPPVHRVSPMAIEMVVLPRPVKQVVKQALPHKKKVTQATMKPKSMPIRKSKPVIDKKTALVQHPIKKPKVQKNKPLQAMIKTKSREKEREKSQVAVPPIAPSRLSKISLHVVSHQTMLDTEQVRQQYISRVMHSIKAHKLYPYSARRRHMEGDVFISFVIDAHGKAKNIQISGQHSVLRRASREAIEAAQPFPIAPKGTESMVQVSFMMQYRLRQ